VTRAAETITNSGDHVSPVGVRATKAAIAPAIRTAVAIALVTLLTWWAFMPLPEVTIDTPRESPPNLPRSAPEPTRLALDLAAFHAPLWIAPPSPPAPTPVPKPEPPPPPLKLQILAIVRESGGADDHGGNRALLYDPDTDKPIWVRPGQTIGRRTVERITAEAVELRDGTLLRTLALREPKLASTALERSLRGTGGSP